MVRSPRHHPVARTLGDNRITRLDYVWQSDQWVLEAMLYTLLVIILVFVAAAVIVNFVRSGGRSV